MLSRRGFLQATGSATVGAIATFRDDSHTRLEAAARRATNRSADDVAGDEDYWHSLPDDDPRAQAHDIYEWVGYLQETVVEALTA